MEILVELEFGWIDFFKPLDTDAYEQKSKQRGTYLVHTSMNSGYTNSNYIPAHPHPSVSHPLKHHALLLCNTGGDQKGFLVG